jgi:cytochrome b561
MSASDVASSLPIPASLLPYLTGELHDYSSLQDSIYKFNITFGVLVIVALALRMYVRWYIIRAAGLDDGA